MIYIYIHTIYKHIYIYIHVLQYIAILIHYISSDVVSGVKCAGRRIALLVEGGLFSTVLTNDPEPFTVVAQSLCEARVDGCR